jgi:hypothetical protein
MADEQVVVTPEPTAAPAVTMEAVVKPVETKPVETKDPKAVDKKGEAEEIRYEETGDPKLDVALAFFGRAGIDADHPALKAAIDGDFDLLEAYLEEKGVPGWQSHIKLAKESHAHFLEQRAEGEAKIVEAVTKTLEKVGYTNEQWGEAIAWARENADPGEIEELNAMMAKPLSAKAAVAYLTGLHSEATNVERAPAKVAVKEEASARSGKPVASNEPISRAQFAQQAEKLAKSYGPDYMSTPEYKQLRQRIR